MTNFTNNKSLVLLNFCLIRKSGCSFVYCNVVAYSKYSMISGKIFIRGFSTSPVLLTDDSSSDSDSDYLPSDLSKQKKNKGKEISWDPGEGSSSGQIRKTDEQLRNEAAIKRAQDELQDKDNIDKDNKNEASEGVPFQSCDEEFSNKGKGKDKSLYEEDTSSDSSSVNKKDKGKARDDSLYEEQTSSEDDQTSDDEGQESLNEESLDTSEDKLWYRVYKKYKKSGKMVYEKEKRDINDEHSLFWDFLYERSNRKDDEEEKYNNKTPPTREESPDSGVGIDELKIVDDVAKKFGAGFDPERIKSSALNLKPEADNPQTRKLHKEMRNHLDKLEDSLRDKAEEYLEAEQNNDTDKMAEIERELPEMMNTYIRHRFSCRGQLRGGRTHRWGFGEDNLETWYSVNYDPKAGDTDYFSDSLVKDSSRDNSSEEERDNHSEEVRDNSSEEENTRNSSSNSSEENTENSNLKDNNQTENSPLNSDSESSEKASDTSINSEAEEGLERGQSAQSWNNSRPNPIDWLRSYNEGSRQNSENESQTNNQQISSNNSKPSRLDEFSDLSNEPFDPFDPD